MTAPDFWGAVSLVLASNAQRVSANFRPRRHILFSRLACMRVGHRRTQGFSALRSSGESDSVVSSLSLRVLDRLHASAKSESPVQICDLA